MNIIFGHDHYFRRDARGIIYSNGGLPYAVFNRYLEFFENITVVGRDGGFVSDVVLPLTISSGANVRFSLVRSISNLNSLLFSNKDVKSQIKNLVAEHDAVVARLPSEIGLILINEAVAQGKPYAIEMVGCPFDAYRNYGSLKAWFYAPFAAYRVRRAVKSAGFVTYVTKSFLQKRYPCNFGLSTNYSDVLISKPDASLLDLRLKKISRTSDVFAIGVIGNYSAKYKGIDVAIKALALSKSSLPPFVFRVLGSGDSSSLKMLACQLGLEGQVFFDSARASGAAVNTWLDELDLYIQPSLTEGLPRALIEAKSRCCPALGTTAGGISELLPLDMLAVPGDEKSLANLLVKLVNSKSRLADSAISNFNDSFEYSIEKLNSRRIDFWSKFKEFCLQ